MTYRLMSYVTTNIGRTFGIRQIKMAFVKCSMGGDGLAGNRVSQCPRVSW